MSDTDVDAGRIEGELAISGNGEKLIGKTEHVAAVWDVKPRELLQRLRQEIGEDGKPREATLQSYLEAEVSTQTLTSTLTRLIEHGTPEVQARAVELALKWKRQLGSPGVKIDVDASTTNNVQVNQVAAPEDLENLMGDLGALVRMPDAGVVDTDGEDVEE